MRIINLDGFVINSNYTITTIFPNNNNFNFFISGNGSNGVAFCKANLTRLIIINNSNSSLGIRSFKSLIKVLIVEFNEEIFIRLPVFIIIDLDNHVFDHFTLTKFHYSF